MQQHEGYCVSVWERWCLIKWQRKRWWWGICSGRKVHAYLSMKRRTHLNSWGRSLIVYWTCSTILENSSEQSSHYNVNKAQPCVCDWSANEKLLICVTIIMRCIYIIFHITWQVQDTSFHVDFQLVSLNVPRKNLTNEIF